MKNKQLKKIGLAFSILVVAVGVFFCGRYIVQAVADNVYVEGDPINITEDEIYLTKPSKDKSVVSVTSSNGVMLPELPKCDDGRVFLEITPDSSTQVLTWLSANNSVISDEELTRRISLVGKGPVKDQNITNGDDVLQPVMGLSYNRFNVWNPEIDLYEKDKDGNYVHEDILKRAEKIKEESTPTNDKGEPIPDDQLTPEQKKKIKEALEEYIKEKCYVDMSLYSVKDKYVIETNAEFGVGPDFEGVSQTALSDKYNWDKEVVEKKTENNGKKTKGYFVRMNGPSDEGVVLDVANKTAAPDSNQSWNQFFMYTEEKPAGKKIQSLDGYDVNDPNWIQNHIYWPISAGDYYEIESGEEWTVKSVTIERNYKYTYHCLTNNDVLKWGLLNPYSDTEHIELKNEKDWKEEYECKFKVVTVTPEQLNEQEKYDTADSVDYIERADLLYLNSLPGHDSQEEKVRQMYCKYVRDYRETTNPDGSISVSIDDSEKDTSYTYNSENDIEWTICMKIIKKLGTYMDFPFLVNSLLWTQNVPAGEDNVPIELYKRGGSWQSKNHFVSLSNASKVAIITSQFNLLARRNPREVVDGENSYVFYPEGLSAKEGERYVSCFKNINEIYTSQAQYKGARTFMEDIYPYIKKIKIKHKDGEKNICEYTGYYDRLETFSGDDKPSNPEKATYLWGNYTFYPIGYDLEFDKERTEAGKESDIGMGWSMALKEKYGYLETFTFTRSSAKDTKETYSLKEGSSNQEMFYGTDANRSSSGKHYQNVVGQPQNMSIFTTDGARFLQIFSAMREILVKPTANGSSTEMIIKVKKPAFEYNTGYGWFLNLYDNDAENNAISEQELVTVTFTVENPESNKNDGYFYVQEIVDSAVSKTPQHFNDELNSKNSFIQEDDCLNVEIKTKSAAVVSGSPWQVVKPKKVPDANRNIIGYKVPAGEKLTFQFKYRLTDYLGTTTGLGGKKYPRVLFTSRVDGYSYILATDVSAPKGDEKAYLVKKEKASPDGLTIQYNENSKKAFLYKPSDAAVWELKSAKPTSGTCIDEDVNKDPTLLDIENLSKIETGDYITIDKSWELLEFIEKKSPAMNKVSLDFMKRHLFNLQ